MHACVHFLDIHKLPGFRCQYSLTCFTTCAECSNKTLILTYTHIYILTCRQTDRQTGRQTDRLTYIDVCTYVHAWTHTCQHANIEVRNKKWPYQASCISLVGPFIIFNIEVRNKKWHYRAFVKHSTTSLLKPASTARQ